MESSEWRTPELLAWLFNESPIRDDVVINDRWGKDTRHKHGGYWTTEYTPGMSGIDHPWEESRGMGFSYGYNRAEGLEHYRTGRELVLVLVDIVSRGGNLLLDIGPAADGTIPVIMEQRLLEIGSWLKINGGAVYGTKPYKKTRQWTAGELPKIDYNQEFNATYDVSKLSAKPEAGQAAIEAFFTSKGNDVYAILPRWPGKSFTAEEVDGANVKSVALLGSSTPLQFHRNGDSITIELPELPRDLLSQPAWVLKLGH
jgi:alpha-L-fucosidase